MSQAHSSFVLIVEQQRLVGIFTEQDLLRAMSNIKLIDTHENNNTFEKIAITEFMTQPVITLSARDAEDLTTVLERFHQHRIRHLPVIDSQGQVLRVITPWQVINNIRHINQLDDGNTTALEPEITPPQEMEQLLEGREIQLNEILDRAIATSIVRFRVFPNRDWVYDYQSVGCETLFGYTSQEITSNKNLWMSRVHPQDVETVILPLFEDICAERTTSVEFRFYHKDGSELWFSATYTSDYDATANCWIVTGSTHDITERQAAMRDRQLIEAELRERNNFIEQIVNYSPQLLYIFDPINASNVYLNSQSVEILGYTPEEIQQWGAKFFLDVLHPDDLVLRERNLKYWQNAVDGEVLITEYRMKCKDGSWRWLRSREVVFTRDENNVVNKVLGITEDISESKRAEQALQEQETFLRSIYDGVGESIFVIDVVNDDFHFVSFNPTCEAITGLMTSDIQGKTPEQLFRAAIAASLRQRYQDCLQAGEPITYEQFSSITGQENWWLTCLTPLRDENSRIYRIVGNSVNITERKRTEQMLELQAVITRNMAEGICLISATDGVFVYTNPKFEQMFGYDSGELIGQHVSIINYTDDNTDAKTVYDRLATIVMQNGAATYEVHNLKKDGTPFWCSATASVFDHPEYGTVFVGVQQDITEQKQAQEKIKTSLKEKEVLLQEIHHRVKNNLGIVSSLLQMQFRRTQDTQVKSILRDSQNRIASIALVHEKLYRSPVFADINFSQYITDLTTHLFETYNVNFSQIQLKTQVDYASLDMKTAIPCGLILNELVSNALKYAFPDNIQGEIKVSFYSENDHNLSLIIEDNGVGLPADFDSKQFTTLGLTLVQGLVKQLQGTIEINSQPGTKFKITFTKHKE